MLRQPPTTLRQRITRATSRIRDLSPSTLEGKATWFSMAVHASILVAFCLMVTVKETKSRVEMSEAFDTKVPVIDRVEIAPLAEAVNTAAVDALAGSFAPEMSKITVNDPVTAKTLEMPNPEVKVADVPLPRAEMMSREVISQGMGVEHVGGSEGAVDRIALEILRRLEDGPVLVVWGFDASGSLVAERERLAKHIGQVYQNILKLDDQDLSAGENLLTMVVGFGKDRKQMLEKPTTNAQEISSAILAVALDESGFESTFTTVGEIARRWGKFERNGAAYQTMTVLVTDEVGDDEDKLEPAIQICKAAKNRVYVLGSAAVFGQVTAMVEYTNPKTKQYYPAIPIRQGPESAYLEQLPLPFWYPGARFDNMDSGFGPYALSRLCGETQGIYFVTRLGGRRQTFDAAKLLEYRPDWGSMRQYEAQVLNNPFRAAVTQAAILTQQKLPNAPSLTFPAMDAPNFKDAMRDGQEITARIAYTVDAALDPLLKVSKLRDRETSKRWQAHYDLAKGRLLAAKIRCYEYNWSCAQLKVNPRKFTKPGSNSWQLVPDKDVHFSEKAAEAGKEAVELLKRVVDEHPDTPWALMAQRELKDPLGFQWSEANVPPPPPPRDNPTPKKAQTPRQPAKPPELPKL